MHQLEKSLVSKHSRSTGCTRAFVFQTGHFKIVVVYPEFSESGCEGARASLRPARDYSRLNGRPAEGRSSLRLTPRELTKITNCNCLLINPTDLYSDKTIDHSIFHFDFITVNDCSTAKLDFTGSEKLRASDRSSGYRYASGGTCSHSRRDCTLEGDEMIDQKQGPDGGLGYE